ncbi:MAG TPA: hypothetical protein VK112_12655 [Fodinibius sp.]|nr:hypothetical protein [Fodinibius sp.]
MLNNEYITNWPAKRQRLKDKYPQLTEDDLGYIAGKEHKLYRRIGRRLGTSKNETRDMLRKI